MAKKIDKKVLFDVGMTEAEAEVYLHLLSTGLQSIQEVTHALTVPRSTVALALETFLEKGIVQVAMEGKRRKFFVRSVDDLQSIADLHDEASRALHHAVSVATRALRKSHFLKEGSSFNASVYSGKASFLEVFQRPLVEVPKGGEYLRISTRPEQFIFDQEFRETYSKRKKKNHLTSRVLIPDTSSKGDLLDYDVSASRTTRCIPTNFFDPKTHIAIWQDTVAVTHWSTDFETIVIESAAYAATMRSLFEIAWKSAKKT